MLTSIEIENFKGIAARQRIDFAPLTLLFGANSAGKSTILQALLYLQEVIERGTADVDHTELGGVVLELGGFMRLVHQHDVDRSIVVRAEFDTPEVLERFGRDLTFFPFPDVDDRIDSAWIEVTIRYQQSTAFSGPMIQRVVIGANGLAEPLVRIENGTSLRVGEPLYVQINFAHPAIATLRSSHPELWPALEAGEPWRDVDSTLEDERHRFEEALEGVSYAAVSQDVLKHALEGADAVATRWQPFFAITRTRLGALPSYSDAVRVFPAEDLDEKQAEADSLARQTSADTERQQKLTVVMSEIAVREGAAKDVRTLIEMLVLGTVAQLAAKLREALYVGPLRAIPPRGFLYERVGRITSWANGLAAWDRLLSDRRICVDETNQWLRRLGANCQVVVQELFDAGADAEQISEHHVDKTIRRLLLDMGAQTLVLPSEVGAGISQVIPVIVAALEPRGGMTMIEQPELHIHPKLQTNLGDLFIVACARRQFLIETHSEHLILRALRRIRETSAGQTPDGDPRFTPEKLSVIYVEATPEGTTFKRLGVDETGEFVDRWPNGFFDERFEEIYGA